MAAPGQLVGANLSLCLELCVDARVHLAYLHRGMGRLSATIYIIVHDFVVRWLFLGRGPPQWGTAD